MTNITGEKLSVDQVIEAILHAGRQVDVIPSHFKAEADLDKSRYILTVEFLEHISKEKGRAFLINVDKNLKHVNIEYKSKRDSMRLANPVLHVMRKGWHEHSQRKLVENGGRAFQAKAQILSLVKSQTTETRPELDQVIEI